MADSKELDNIKKRISFLESELDSVKKDLQKLETGQTPAQEKQTILDKIPISKPDLQWNFEKLAGVNLFGSLGLIALILAFIWFLKFAFDNYWINESGRVAIGLFCGFLVSGAGLYLAKKNFPILSPSIFGSGLSILYLSVFSAYRYYDLFGIEETFIFLAMITAFGVFISYISTSQIIFVFGALGAFLNPILLSTGENSYKFLFTYLTLFNLAFLWISRKHPWRFAGVFVPVFNLIIFFEWSIQNLSQSSFAFPIAFLSIWFVGFLYREAVLQSKNLRVAEFSSALSILIVGIGFSINAYFVVKKFYPNLVPHVFLAYSFVPLFLAPKAESFLENLKIKPSFLAGLFLILSSSLVLFAINEMASGPWLSISIVLLAGGLAYVGSYSNNKVLLVVSILFWVYAVIYLLFGLKYEETIGVFVFNTRFAAYLLATAFLYYSYKVFPGEKESFFPRLFVILSIFLLIYGTLVENYHLIADRHYRNLGYTIVIGIYAGLFLYRGFQKESLPLRKVAVVLFFILIGKFYLYDIMNMSQIVKIIAGFVFGIGLVIAGIYYEKFKNKLLGEK